MDCRQARLGRIGLDVVAGQHGKRVYALIDAGTASGLYRSDDGGEEWNLVSTEPRILSRGWYFGEVRSDPKNPDVVYVSNVSLYRSTDGGKNFKAIRGAPGGDDYHSLWIDPENPRRMISGVDQGTIVTLNGGKTWSSWYNQPTAQFYHVAVDNQFPYWVYGAQQDSGTAAVVSRSDYGQITYRDWHPIGAGESGYILPDPVNPQIVYGGSTGGELYRFDTKTGQVQDVSPTPAEIGTKVRHRYPWTTPIAFSFQAPHALYQASQFLMKTADGGKSWKIISPDLTLRPGEKEEDAKGVIYTIAPSPIAAGTIWIGTDNGLVQLTRNDGQTWTEVSPPGFAALEHDQFDRCFATRCGDGLRGHRSSPDGRHHAPHLPHSRFRQDLDEDHQRNSRDCLRACRARRSDSQRACCLPALKPASMFLSTTANCGNPCNSIFRSLRCATWWLRETILLLPRTDVPSGYSTTFRRCAN